MDEADPLRGEPHEEREVDGVAGQPHGHPLRPAVEHHEGDQEQGVPRVVRREDEQQGAGHGERRTPRPVRIGAAADHHGHDEEDRHGRVPCRPLRQQEAQQSEARPVVVALLAQIAGQVADHRRAGHQHIWHVGRGDREHRHASGQQGPAPRAAHEGRGREHLHRDRGTGQHPAEDRAARRDRREAEDHEQHAEAVDVAVVARFEDDHRTPRPQHRVPRVATETPQHEQQGGGHRDRDESRRGLHWLASAVGGDRVHAAVPELRDGRVDRVHGRPVHERAGAVRQRVPEPSGAVSGREQPVVAQVFESGVLRAVAVRRDPRRLDASVPRVAVRVVARLRHRGHGHGLEGDGPEQDQRDGGAARDAAHDDPCGEREQHPGDGVGGIDARGVGARVGAAYGVGEGAAEREGDRGGQGGPCRDRAARRRRGGKGWRRAFGGCRGLGNPRASRRCVGRRASRRCVGPRRSRGRLGPRASRRCVGPRASRGRLGPRASRRCVGPRRSRGRVGFRGCGGGSLACGHAPTIAAGTAGSPSPRPDVSTP